MGKGIRPASKRSIQIDFRWNGRRYREKIKLIPTPANLKYASRLKATIEHEIATGTFVYRKHFAGRHRDHGNDDSGNIQGFIDSYIGTLEGQVEPETLGDYREFSRILGTHFKGNPNALTRQEIREWIGTQRLSAKRLNNLLTPLRGAYKQAIEDGTLKENPLEGFKVRRIGKVKESLIDPFTREEVERLSGAHNGHVWQFWAWTGLRTGELIGLRWGDVDIDGATVSVRRSIREGREKNPKTYAGIRVVRLLRPARRVLEGLRSDGNGDETVIFRNPSDERPYYRDKPIRLAFRRACKECNVRYRYPYQLRHTYASLALSAGENVHWVARQMGHANALMVLKVYGKWMPDADPNAGSKMEALA